jgi:membrane-bound serine protease (ClpP class)
MSEGSDLILVLFGVGFLLIAAEVFVPGMIVGSIGFLCLAGSVALVFVNHGPAAGFISALVVGGLSIGGFLVWLQVFPRTPIGRKLMLQRSQPPDPGLEVNQSLVGSTGFTLTPLRPAGTARINGNRVDVTASSEFLPEGEEIVVVAADGMRVVVRRKDGLEAGAKPV